MRLRRTKIFVCLWCVCICLLAEFISCRVQALSGDQVNIMEECGQRLIKGSLEAVYPVMACQQQAESEGFVRSVIRKTCYHAFPLAQYVEDKLSEKNMYATQMESSLSDEELQEILEREAADENHVDASGEVVQAEGAAGQSETQIAQQVLQQFAGELETVQTDSENVLSESAGNQTVTGQDYPLDMLSYDFLINHFYVVDSTTSISKEQLDAGKLLEMDMTMKGDNSNPQILIYHTHSQESFIDSVEGDADTSIVGIGDYLARLLHDQYGYNVLHNRASYDLIDGRLDRNKAYTLALTDIEKLLEENPSIEVVIDLHRDGIDGKKLVSNVNGQETAQLMFFNGLSYTNKNGPISYLENPYLEDNLAFSLQLQLEAAKYYPGAMRKIYLKGYRYNMHVRPKSLLVESGTQNNTVQEEKNAMNVLADILNKVLSGQ